MAKTKRRILIIDNDRNMQREYLSALAEYDVVLAASRIEGVSAFQRSKPGVVLLELGLPPDPAGASEGLAIIQDILPQCPETKIIVVSGNHEHKNELKAISLGAYDFYQKPAELDILKLIIGRAFYLNALEIENRLLQTFKPSPLEGVIAGSPQMLEVCRMAARVAPTDASLLLLGASGTGKERIAQALHKLSPRRQGDLVAINCAAIPAALLESELFGHEKGAFTGATSRKTGKIERADGGTLFLDEIGDLPLELQTKLLRFIQERVMERVGGFAEIPIDTRIVCATHQNLQAMIARGEFREDLYYRISEVTLKIPSLKDREGDAILLAKVFLEQINSKLKFSPGKVFSSEALRAIEAYSWPGNVRELENKIMRATILSANDYISAADLDLGSMVNVETVSLNLKEARDKAERRVVRRAMFESNDNVTEAAKLLGVARPTVYKLLEKYHLHA